MSGTSWPTLFSGTFQGSGSSELEDVKAKVESLKREKVTLSDELSVSNARLAELEAKAKEAARLLHDAEAKQEEMRAEVDAARSKTQSLNRALQASNEQWTRHQADLQALRAELASVRNEKAEFEKRMNAADARVATHATELAAMERNFRQASDKAESLQRELDEAQRGKEKPIVAVIVSAASTLAIAILVKQFKGGRPDEEL